MNLDNLAAIRRMDKKNVAASIANLPKQLLAAFEDAKAVKLPATFGRANNIVFCGMGGSNLASELLRAVYAAELKIPLTLVRGYDLPAFANKDTLVIVDSYSGNTEETVSCLEQAHKLKAKIICIASGGKIESLAKRRKLTLLKLNPTLNPSGQPRYDIGSQLGIALYIFSKLKLISINAKDLSATASILSELGQQLLPTVKTKDNAAKLLAQQLNGKSIVIVAGEHLSANAHILANQINESAKQLAFPLELPELNHHFLEALSYPKKLTRDTAAVFLVSPDFSPRLAKRVNVTRTVMDRQGISNFAVTAATQSNLTQALELLSIGGWTSFYLAMINRVNPADIPWVDYFKTELDK